MNREEIREKTMQLIYQMDITGEFDYGKASPVDENVINEAVKMSKRFSDEKSYAFVNSVLSKIDKYLSSQNKSEE